MSICQAKVVSMHDMLVLSVVLLESSQKGEHGLIREKQHGETV